MEYNLKCGQYYAKKDSHFIKHQVSKMHSLHHIGITGWSKPQYRPLWQLDFDLLKKDLHMYDKNMFQLTFVMTALCLSYNNGIKSWTCTSCA